MASQHEEVYVIPRDPGLITYPEAKRPQNLNRIALPPTLPPPSFLQRISVYHITERFLSGFSSRPKELGHIELSWRRPTYRQLHAQILDLLDENKFHPGKRVEIEIRWRDEDVAPTLLNAEVLEESLEWMKRRKWKDALTVKMYLDYDEKALLRPGEGKWPLLYELHSKHDTTRKCAEAWNDGRDPDRRRCDSFYRALEEAERAEKH